LKTLFDTPRLSDLDSVSPDPAQRATRMVFVSSDTQAHITCLFGAEVLDQLFTAVVESAHPGLPQARQAQDTARNIARALSAKVQTNPSGGVPLLHLEFASGITLEVPLTSALREAIASVG
jgi:hypothetical protein